MKGSLLEDSLATLTTSLTGTHFIILPLFSRPSYVYEPSVDTLLDSVKLNPIIFLSHLKPFLFTLFANFCSMFNSVKYHQYLIEQVS